MGKRNGGLHGGEPSFEQVVKELLRDGQVLPDMEQQAGHCVVAIEVGGPFYLRESG
jgi:hypothetical protein